MKNDDREHVAPSMCYAYAALAEGAPFIMGAPNTTVDIPAMGNGRKLRCLSLKGLQNWTNISKIWICSDYWNSLLRIIRVVLY